MESTGNNLNVTQKVVKASNLVYSLMRCGYKVQYLVVCVQRYCTSDAIITINTTSMYQVTNFLLYSAPNEMLCVEQHVQFAVLFIHLPASGRLR